MISKLKTLIRWSKKQTPMQACSHCGFWLMPAQIYCPNCNQSRSFSWAFIPFKVLVFSAGTLGIITLFHQLEIALTWANLGIGLGEGLAVTGSLWGAVWFSSDRFLGWSILPQRPISCLQKDETTIHDRLRYLQHRQEPIEQVRHRATKILDSQRRNTILAALDHALGILQTHHDRYQIKLWEIALLRWYNQVQLILTSVPILDEQNIDILEQILEAGQQLLEDWGRSELSDRSVGYYAIDRLQGALRGCDQIYQDLIALQASAVIQGISHFEVDPQRSLQTPEAEDFLEIFSVLPSVSEFSLGFQALEQEYLRLQSELDLDKALKSRI